MPTVTHVRNEVWDEATKEFRFKSLPTTPDVVAVMVRDDVSASPNAKVTLGSVVVPPGSVLRVTLLRYLTDDARGAMYVLEGEGTVDVMYLPGAGESLMSGDVESPVYVLEGTVTASLLTKYGTAYPGTTYGIVIHGYYSRQESVSGLT